MLLMFATLFLAVTFLLLKDESMKKGILLMQWIVFIGAVALWIF